MVNFIDSFNQGMSAAQKAIANKDEIDSVIDALSEQLLQASGGKIKISIAEKATPLFAMFAASAEDLLARRKRWSVVASNPLASYQPKELAEWKFDENGYPCRLITTETEMFCEDREALEDALNKLLSAPGTGKKLKAVMEQKPKE
ncbi:hypothetical protein CI807_03580 [Pseudomonas sp. NS1(2017)]|uniref:hypothetical protein n=1 Tax=Pseudomonas sp. NS1(2017) TaxID=2025658 RepID=UPI000BA24EB7|nr:hypothetical protein [Pseudomonas sp. NS1(2017)]ASV35300.1 hypothetical protein CI807_03580 [Pseudomonas sp. NS1(2017)]